AVLAPLSWNFARLGNPGGSHPYTLYDVLWRGYLWWSI
ncbi:unnamed protein product, partial [marine sediment metagenome]